MRSNNDYLACDTSADKSAEAQQAERIPRTEQKKEKTMKFHRFIFAERGGLATSLLIVASLYAFPLPRRRAPCKNLTSQGVDKSTLSIFRYYATQMNLRA